MFYKIFKQISPQPIETTTRRTTNSDDAVQQHTKRYQLFEMAYTYQNRIAWSEQVLNEIGNYLSDLKVWSFSHNETFNKLHIYKDLQTEIDSNINLLDVLQKDSDNCAKQMKFSEQYKQMKMFQQSLIENDQLFKEWMEKDRILLRKLLFFTIRPYKKFYAKLELEVEKYLNNLDFTEISQEENLREWYEKFVLETDFVEKLILIAQFTELFSEERNIQELKCIPAIK